MATRKKTNTPKKSATQRKSAAAPKKVIKPITPITSPVKLPKTNLNPRFLGQVLLVILLGVGMFLLAKQYRGLVVAGTVNKSIITRWELNNLLTKRYGQAVLEELVNNELLRVEAEKQGITVTDEDIAAERQNLVDNLGGEEGLQQALVQYGLSEVDLADQIRLRLLQERLAEKLFSTEVTDEEVKTYFDANKALYEDKEFDAVKEEIKTGLLQQKTQQEFLTWFNQLKEEADINIYID